MRLQRGYRSRLPRREATNLGLGETQISRGAIKEGKMPANPSLRREKRKLDNRSGCSGPKLVARIAIGIAAFAGTAESSGVRKSEGNATGSSCNPQFLFAWRLSSAWFIEPIDA